MPDDDPRQGTEGGTRTSADRSARIADAASAVAAAASSAAAGADAARDPTQRPRPREAAASAADAVREAATSAAGSVREAVDEKGVAGAAERLRGAPRRSSPLRRLAPIGGLLLLLLIVRRRAAVERPTGTAPRAVRRRPSGPLRPSPCS